MASDRCQGVLQLLYYLHTFALLEENNYWFIGPLEDIVRFLHILLYVKYSFRC